MTRRRRAHHRRVGAVAVWLCAAGLAGTLACLELIGPPPAVRVDALWVNGRRAEVQFAVAGFVLALLGTLLAVLSRRNRFVVAVLLAAATALCIAFFSDRIPVLARVLIRHAG